jgi:hypothetical protein
MISRATGRTSDGLSRVSGGSHARPGEERLATVTVLGPLPARFGTVGEAETTGSAGAAGLLRDIGGWRTAFGSGVCRAAAVVPGFLQPGTAERHLSAPMRQSREACDIACSSDFGMVLVAEDLARAVVAHFEARRLPCGLVAYDGGQAAFAVPAGAGEYAWPETVAYRPGGSWPVPAVHPVTGLPSAAYQQLTTPASVLWAVLAALACTRTKEAPAMCNPRNAALPRPPGPTGGDR